MIVLQNMGGVAPRVTPELLPDAKAQTALNVKLVNGGVKSLKTPTTVATQTKAGTAQTIYRFGHNAGESQYWFKWTTNVNVARGPIAGDTEETTYYSGDGLPKKTKFSLATSSGTDYPMAFFNLKVPAPTTAPILMPTAGTGPTITETRAYVYTNVTSWGEESREVSELMYAAKDLAKKYPDSPVPLHIRNAPTKLIKDLGYGKDYKWEADFKHAKGFLPKEIIS
jgi:hypothetical protein